MIPRVLDAAFDPELTGSAYRVLLYFAQHLEPGTFKERKVSVIHHDLGLPERTVKRAIAQLIERGYIEAGTGSPRASSPQVYKLLWARRAA